jgi:hypothetical protein
VTNEYETLRFPTKLDRQAMEQRLIQVREKAEAAGLIELVGFFTGLEAMSPPQFATAVIGALTWLEGKPEVAHLTKQVEIVALNLKNLRA